MQYPNPKKNPHSLNLHGHERIDPYFWMRDRENAEVINHLKAENAYTDAVLAPTKALQQTLFEEMKGRIKEDDSSAPYLKNGYWYYTRFEEGKGHPIYCRKKGDLSAEEEILLDENIEAENYSYYEIVAFSITKDNKMMAFAEDRTGRRLYTIRFKDLETGHVLPDIITHTGSDLAWHNDNKTLYYSVKEEDTLRPYLIRRYELIEKNITDIFEEKDETYIVNLNKSGDFNYILIGSHSTLTTEFQFKSANDDSPFECFFPRSGEHEYYPESAGEGLFYIKTNHEAKNFKLVKCHVTERAIHQWQTIIPHRSEVLLEDFDVFDTHIAVQEKENGLTRLNILDRETYSAKSIPVSEETYTLYLGNNPEPSSTAVRVGYSSMTTPHSVISIELDTFAETLLKQTEVQGDFKPEYYQSERVWVTASDGVKVPVSLVYRKDQFSKSSTNPLLLYGYGSYGATIDPYFSSARLSLLDRGFVFAIAHVRGSEYLGTEWYEDGKLLKKKNTFTDFITAAEQLVDKGYADPQRLFAMGGSAGGLLMGAVVNLRPELWRGIVSQVPFVDVVSTMIDDSIPLTTGEYDEWGNPNEKKYYDYMLSYSPYDQIVKTSYPAMLVTSGLHDSQVQYWEPTKYVAKIRDFNTANAPVLLKTNMEAGHGGASGRYEQLRELAEEYAFILWVNESNGSAN